MEEPSKVMKITDPTGEVYYLEGNDELEAIESFGRGCEIRHGEWSPLEEESTE